MPLRNTYANLVSEMSQAHTRLIRDHDRAKHDFDLIVIGSGIGGGILVDDPADRIGTSHRILVVDAGAFIYPAHVYNNSPIPNGAIANHFGAANFGFALVVAPFSGRG